MLGYLYGVIGAVVSAAGRFLKTFGSWLCKTGDEEDDGF